MSRSFSLLAVLACLLVLTFLPATTASGPRHSPLQSLLPNETTTTTIDSIRSTLPPALRDAHFINNITVATGSWTGTISVLYQYLTFTDTTGATIHSFPVDPTTPYQFGTVLFDSDTFDVMYQITLVEGTAWPRRLSTDRRVCLYVISAYSAGKPQIMTMPFMGSKVNCTWTNDGFYQSFRAE